MAKKGKDDQNKKFGNVQDARKAKREGAQKNLHDLNQVNRKVGGGSTEELGGSRSEPPKREHSDSKPSTPDTGEHNAPKRTDSGSRNFNTQEVGRSDLNAKSEEEKSSVSKPKEGESTSEVQKRQTMKSASESEQTSEAAQLEKQARSQQAAKMKEEEEAAAQARAAEDTQAAAEAQEKAERAAAEATEKKAVEDAARAQKEQEAQERATREEQKRSEETGQRDSDKKEEPKRETQEKEAPKTETDTSTKSADSLNEKKDESSSSRSTDTSQSATDTSQSASSHDYSSSSSSGSSAYQPDAATAAAYANQSNQSHGEDAQAKADALARKRKDDAERAAKAKKENASQGAPKRLGTPEDMGVKGGANASVGQKRGVGQGAVKGQGVGAEAGQMARGYAAQMAQRGVRALEGEDPNSPHLISGGMGAYQGAQAARGAVRSVGGLKVSKDVMKQMKAWGFDRRSARQKAAQQLLSQNTEKVRRFKDLQAQQFRTIERAKAGEIQLRTAWTHIMSRRQEILKLGMNAELRKLTRANRANTIKKWQHRSKQTYRYARHTIKNAPRNARNAAREAKRLFSEDARNKIKTLRAVPKTMNTALKTMRAALKNPKETIGKMRAIGSFVGATKGKLAVFGKLGAMGKGGGLMSAGRLLTGVAGKNTQHGQADSYGDAFKTNQSELVGKTMQGTEVAWKVSRRFNRGINHASRRLLGKPGALKGLNTAGKIKTIAGNAKAMAAAAKLALKAALTSATVINPWAAAAKLGMAVASKIFGKVSGMFGKMARGAWNAAISLVMIVPMLGTMIGGSPQEGSSQQDGSTPVTPWGFILAVATMAAGMLVTAAAMGLGGSEPDPPISDAGQRRLRREGQIATVLEAYIRAPITGNICIGRCQNYHEDFWCFERRLSQGLYVPNGGACPLFNQGYDENGDPIPDCVLCRQGQMRSLHCQMEAIDMEEDIVPADQQPRAIFRRAHQSDPVNLQNISRANLLTRLHWDYVGYPASATETADTGGEDGPDAAADEDWLDDPGGAVNIDEDAENLPAYELIRTREVRIQWIRRRGQELQTDRDDIRRGAEQVLEYVENFIIMGNLKRQNPNRFPFNYIQNPVVQIVIPQSLLNEDGDINMHSLDIVGVAAYLNHNNEGQPNWKGREGREGISIFGLRIGQRDPVGLDYFINRIFMSGREDDDSMYAGNLLSEFAVHNSTSVFCHHQGCTLECEPYEGHVHVDECWCCDIPNGIHYCWREARANISDIVELRALHDAWPFPMRELNEDIVRNEVVRAQYYAWGANPDCHATALGAHIHWNMEVGDYNNAEAHANALERHPHRRYSMSPPIVAGAPANWITIAGSPINRIERNLARSIANNKWGYVYPNTEDISFGPPVLATTLENGRVSMYRDTWHFLPDRYDPAGGVEIIEHEDRQSTTIIETFATSPHREIHFGLTEEDGRRLYRMPDARYDGSTGFLARVRNPQGRRQTWGTNPTASNATNNNDTNVFPGYVNVISGPMLDTREGWHRIFAWYEEMLMEVNTFWFWQDDIPSTPPVLYNGYHNILYLATPLMRLYYPPDNFGGHWSPVTPVEEGETQTRTDADGNPLDPDDFEESDLRIQNFPYTFYNRSVYILRSVYSGRDMPIFASVAFGNPGYRGRGRKESDQQIFRSRDHNWRELDDDYIQRTVFDGFLEDDIFTGLRDREELFNFHFPLIDDDDLWLCLDAVNAWMNAPFPAGTGLGIDTPLSTDGGILAHPLAGSGTFTSAFGWRIHPITSLPSFHSGIDIGAPAGTNIVAAEGGEVVSRGYQANGYGHWIVLRHDIPGVGIVYTHYSHMQQASTLQPGTIVGRGDTIGHVGSTGASTGPHLHFEVRVGGNSVMNVVDPVTFLLDQGPQEP